MACALITPFPLYIFILVPIIQIDMMVLCYAAAGCHSNSWGKGNILILLLIAKDMRWPKYSPDTFGEGAGMPDSV